MAETMANQGAEDFAYIYVDLQHIDDSQIPTPGSTITLQSLGTSAPQMQLPDGTIVSGKYEGTIGSFVFFDKPCNTELPSAAKGAPQSKATFLCHTEKLLTMQPSSPPQTSA
ncbi:TPA: hypothetical protein ACH3X3_015115 [Trebouxia sp. C0006]